MKQENKTPIAQFSQVTISGPLPAPEILQQYDNIVPNAAERIISLAEQEAEHRRLKELTLIRNNTKIIVLSLILSFISVLAMVGIVIYSLYLGSFGGAIGATIGSISALAGVFVYVKSKFIKEDK